MLTTRRPVIPPKGGVAYCYLDGNIYYETEGSHMELVRQMLDQGIPRSALDAYDPGYSAIFGYIWNTSDTEEPKYVNDQYSDIYSNTKDPQKTAELNSKLRALFPDITTDTSGPYFEPVKWTLSHISDTIDPMSDMTPIETAIQGEPAASMAIRALNQAGGRVFVVGGAVRDAILGHAPKDVDLMVQGLDGDAIENALKGLGRLDFTGKQFGVYRFKSGTSEVEIALPRTEVSTGPGHQDFQVTTDPNLDPEQDLARRDFTGNAMAYEPATGQLIDPYGGAEDLKNGTLSLVNDKAFEDDPLRVVRALVANARFGLEPDEQLKQSLADNAQKIKHLPGERIQAELDKLLSAPDPAKTISLAEQSGLIPYLFPELEAAVGFDQHNPHHDMNVFDHTLSVLKKMSTLSNDPDMRLAALFHDSGKPESYWNDENHGGNGGGHFYKKVLHDGTVIGADHEDVGARNVRAFMTRMRYPKDRIDRVEKLIKFHMWNYFNSEKGARKFLRALDGDTKMAFDLLAIREADSSGKRDGEPNNYDREMIDKDRQLLQDVIAGHDAGEQHAFTIKDLAVNGHDLISLGLKGPEIGKTLNYLLDLVIDHPALNEKETLMKVVDEGVRV